ncbi:MAG: transglutaminase domain-containing protein [Bacteroidales bacterium]|nr:transglutaminase domain-containing protein [Bacteroidales bacterium]
MKNLFIIIVMSIIVSGCGHSLSKADLSDANIEKVIAAGNFTEAEKLIKTKIATEELTPAQVWDLNFKIEVMDRIRKDFNKDDSTIFAQLQKYYPEVTREDMAKWEEKLILESMIIDGEKKYYKYSARNVFRIDEEAEQLFNKTHPYSPDPLDTFVDESVTKVLKTARKTGKSIVEPEKLKIRYWISVKPDEVPAGEVVRVWMPYLRNEDIYKNIKLVATSQPDYIISPEQYAHRSIYMEKVAEAGKRTEFWYEMTFTTHHKFHDFEPQDVKPYDTQSELYKTYTAERAPHIVFSDRIKNITDSLVKGETNPYLKSVRIFDWICDHFPWASAREYSTLDNIPEYVITNDHGDCGQVALLFITMARYAGIPAKWESGWMLHPMEINLHDWVRVYYEGVGWVGVDPSFGRVILKEELEHNAPRGRVLPSADKSKLDSDYFYFYTHGMDAWRFIVNSDYSQPFYPAKIHPRSETVDFQRGEVEWRGENLYFGRWNYDMELEIL